MTDLCSAVFVLRPNQPFSIQAFMGRAVHKLFLLMLGHLTEVTGDPAYQALADRLHDQNAALPFTVSDLFSSGGEHYWVRFTGLDAAICRVLQTMVETLPGYTLIIPPRIGIQEAPWTAKVAFAATSQHEWADATTYAALIRQASTARSINLEFFTPTAIKSVGIFRAFPEPSLIFRLLYERLLRLNGVRLPFQPEVAHVEAFAEYLICVQSHHIICAQTQHNRSPVTTFTGHIAYRILSKNDAFEKRARTRMERDGDASLLKTHHDIMEHHAQYARLMHLLASFAFYSGIGSYTGQGMGMMRKVAQDDR